MPITKFDGSFQLKQDTVGSSDITDHTITAVDIAPGSLDGSLFITGSIPVSKINLTSLPGDGLSLVVDTLSVNVDPAMLQIVADVITTKPVVTLLGNTFNGINQLVQLDGAGKLPAVDGSALAGMVYHAGVGTSSIVGSGIANSSSGYASISAGGDDNNSGGTGSTVSGGLSNTSSGVGSTVSGGTNNVASGNLSTVPGGSENEAAGVYSFAAGRYAHAVHRNSSVWSDGLSPEYTTADYQYRVKAAGGIIFTGSLSVIDGTQGASKILTSDGGGLASWQTPPVTTDASLLTAGTLGDLRLSSNVTIQGNTFNGVSQLVQTDGTGKLPAIDGSALTGITIPPPTTDASLLTSGTLDDARLSASVTVQGNTFNGLSQLVKLDGTGKLPAVDGSALTGISSVATALATTGYPVLSGLVANWKMDEASGTVLADSSGNGHAATLLADNPRVPGVAGNAINIPDTGGGPGNVSAVSADSILDWNAGDWTVSGWFKIGVTTSPLNGIFGFGQTSDGWHLYRQSSGVLELLLGGTSISSLGTVTDTASFHHYALTRSGTTYTVYVDGVSTGSTIYAGTISSGGPGLGLAIGGWAYIGFDAYYNWAGPVDEVSLFNRALSGPEVATITANVILPGGSTPVSVLAAPPVSGKALTATSATTATWQVVTDVALTAVVNSLIARIEALEAAT
jgi:hypothetical protein